MEIQSTRPYFREEDLASISLEMQAILRSGRLVMGPYTQRLEESFRNYVGVKHAICVSTCTAALELVLRYLDVKNREVIASTNSFTTACNAVISAGGIPILADIRSDSLCLDPEEMRKKINPKTKGVILVHIGGLVSPDTREIRDTCRQKGLFLIEDCAHAIGGTLDNQKAGSFGEAGCFSFYPTKVMTTGTGGMITTNDDGLANYAISARDFGKGKERGYILNFGNDWLMDEISALIGCYQFKELEVNLKRRNEIAHNYDARLGDLGDVKLFKNFPNIRHTYYKYSFHLTPRVKKQWVMEKMRTDFNISLGSIYDPPVHLQPLYKQLFGYHEGMFPVAEEILSRTCCLPVFPQITQEEINYVCDSLKTTLLSAQPSK
jgi:perosamine synthetase